MQTEIYFVRHAEPDLQNHNDRLRELTAKGEEGARKVAQFLRDKEIDTVFSSPYRRAVQTVKPFAQSSFMPIVAVEDFRERAVSEAWIGDYDIFCKKQWEDFEYKLRGGESLSEVQSRVVKAWETILKEHKGENVVAGIHGTALAVLLNHLDPSFGYEQFRQMPMPWIVCMTLKEKEKRPHIKYVSV